MNMRECGQVAEHERSRVTVVAEAWSERVRSSVRLIERTAGYEPAGSAMRWTDAGWAVNWHSLGAIQGQRYRHDDEAKARAHYAKLTEGNPS